MLTHKKLISGLFSILLLVGAYLGTRPQNCADGICTEQRLDAPACGAPGKHPVGSRVLVMAEEPNLALSIWYSGGRR